MTRSFLRRAAIAAVLLPLGLISVWGENSLYDQFISSYGTLQVAIVLGALSAFWCALALWVCRAFKFPPGGHWRDLPRCKAAAVIAVVSAACLAGHPAHAMSMVVAGPNTVITTNNGAFTISTVKIEQPFTLSPEQQRQVDAAIAGAGKEAQENPGFVVTVEAAIGIFIAAVVVGTVLYIIVRMTCKSLDRIKQSLNNRLSRLKEFLADPSKTNSPAVLGAALFNHRPATINDLSTGTELIVGFTASEEPPVLAAAVTVGETVTFDEFLNDFGLTDKLPLDSVVGSCVTRDGSRYVAAPIGAPNLVTISFESCSNLARGVWKSTLSLGVPVGAVLDFADLTGNSENRYWRVGVAQ